MGRIEQRFLAWGSRVIVGRRIRPCPRPILNSLQQRPRRRRGTTSSSSAPGSPACTSSICCASWVSRRACTRLAPASAGPGTGTVTPGARFDSESWTYGFSFSEELLQEWEWSEHFSAQPETLRYCNFVADKFDLRRDIEFKTSDAAHAFDMIVYATGFDAITGAFDRIDIRGIGGRRLKDRWAHGPRTYLGLGIVGFPNMFTLVGPHNAATFCNIPRCIEQNVEWVTALLRHMRARNLTRVEPTTPAEAAWTEHVWETAQRLLLTRIDSWMTGINTNVPGKDKRTFLVYAGGAPGYRKRCDEVAAKGYEGFLLQ